jgi:hypothetical protein
MAARVFVDFLASMLASDPRHFDASRPTSS